MKTFDFFSVRPVTEADRPWLRGQLKARWGGTLMAVHGEAVEMMALPALLAGNSRGFLVYRVRGLAAEIVVLDAIEMRAGVGTALLMALDSELARIAVQELWVTTTNDNLDALRFYQRRGFRLEGVRRDAVAMARRLKPAIPHLGAYAIPVCDEIDLQAALPLRWSPERRG